MVSILKPQHAADTFRYPAIVKSKTDASIVADGDGVLEKILVRLGSKVTRGQVLFVVRNTDPAYVFAPLRIAAPVSGIVSEILVSRGARIRRDQNLAKITDPSKLEIQIDVPASDSIKLKPGTVAVFVESNSHKSYSARLMGLSPSIDVQLGTAAGQLDVDSVKDSELRPGQIGEVRIQINKRIGLFVSEESVTFRGEKAWVRIVDGKTLKKVPVILSGRNGDFWEVGSGLQEGAKVVERTSRFASDGEQVDLKIENN